VRFKVKGNYFNHACLAPSFPAAFHPIIPEKVIFVVRKLGFSEVWEVAFGAELVSRAYAKLFRTSLHHGNRVISTACPAIVSYIEGKYVTHRRGEDTKD
jgi:iron only hydrogenase large subunit-like protein